MLSSWPHLQFLAIYPPIKQDWGWLAQIHCFSTLASQMLKCTQKSLQSLIRRCINVLRMIFNRSMVSACNHLAKVRSFTYDTMSEIER